ncbi:hypothetical protein GCM10017687_36750 [Streptomyces echinatus]
MAGELVAVRAGLDREVRGRGQAGEVVGVDEQFRLARHGEVDRPAHLGGVADRGVGGEQFDGRAQGAVQPEVADVADEHVAAGHDQVERPGEHVGQVVGAGEVLDDGVQDDGVEEPRGQAVEEVGGLGAQLDPAGQLGPAFELGADPVDDDLGDVGAPVGLAVRRQRREEQAAADTDLQHPAGAELSYPGHGGVPPPPHLLDRDGLPRVAAVPAGEVLAQTAGQALVVGVVGGLPVAELLPLGRLVPVGVASPAGTRYAASCRSPGRSSRASTAACCTPGCRASTASTSPGSIRKPRIFTCASARPA